MKLSKLLTATLREAPADAEIISHKLMLRAGMIRQLASGIYTWLPLGYRTLKKVEAIVRQSVGSVKTCFLDNCGHSPHRDQEKQTLEAMALFVRNLPV